MLDFPVKKRDDLSREEQGISTEERSLSIVDLYLSRVEEDVLFEEREGPFHTRVQSHRE
jgi:hypothetical protein